MAEVSRVAAVGGPTQEAEAVRLSLSPRRWQILSEICHGKDYPEIAERMCLDPKTIRNHVNYILSIVEDTLGWRPKNRWQLAVWAWTNRLFRQEG